MDKWEDLTQRIQNALLAEEPEAAVSAGFQLVCEFGRSLEMISGDLDRIATALEGTQRPSDVPVAVAQPVHDL